MNTHKNIKWLLLALCWFAQISIPSCRKCKSTISFGPGTHCSVGISQAYSNSLHPRSNSDSFSFHELRLDMNVQIETANSGICFKKDNKFSLFTNHALACPASGHFIESIQDSIVNVEIFDIMGFNDSGKVENISEYIEFKETYTKEDSAFFNLDSLKTSNFLNSYLFGEGIHNQTLPFTLRLKQAPAKEKVHQFEIIVHLNTGRKIEALSKMILIK